MRAMECPACVHPNPDDARFCNACGASLSASCANCGNENPPGARFCNACGQGVSSGAGGPGAGDTDSRLSDDTDPRSYTPKHLADRILTQKHALEGERRHVTVLFADLADSTAMAEALADPEEMHMLLDRAFRVMLEVIHGYEGTINQFTGDGVMALFGAPVALEGAPRRAVIAALDIQKALAPLDAEVRRRHGRPFEMRIGIHSGPVVVGSIGDDLRMDYTAVGDTTNLAARLEGSAVPGTVVISDAVHRQVDGYFEIEDLPAVEFKGKSAPVGRYSVVAARATATGRIDVQSERTDGLTPYVGREREIDSLMAAYEQAKQGHGQVAFVVGEAGIGKSRLLHEFRQRIADDPHSWIEGRCASYARSSPFHAIADAVRRVHGIDDRDDEHEALAKIAAREVGLGGDLSWTLPYIRVLLSLPSGDAEVDAMDAMRRRAEMCRALLARVLRPDQPGAQVIVLEDMHWTDAATEEFLAFLADSIPAVPTLIVVTHRPGYTHSLGDRSYHVRVPLQALSSDAMSEMVDAVLHASSLPNELRDAIAEKAEGNPLFVEEVTTSLIEEGIVVLEDGRARLTRDLADISIPDRIQDVLMARLDRLAEEPKRAIQLASIIGREFAWRLLQRIHQASDHLEEIVSELRALELIYEKAAHPELAYMFKHALTHEVAYESVLLGRRKNLHRVVGTAIEELYPERLTEHYEALAHHFSAGEEEERALHYHELASHKSLKAYANHAAVDHCRKAIGIAERLEGIAPERLRALWERIGVCCWMLSDFGASWAAYKQAAALTATPEHRAALLAAASWSALWDHDYPECRELLEAAASASTEEQAPAAAAFSLVCRDELEVVHGATLEDDGLAERALVLARRAGDAAALSAALGQLAQRAEMRGEYRSTIAYAEEAVAIADRNGTPGDAIFAGWFLGIARVCIGDYAQGLKVLGDGLVLCERVGDRAIKGRLLNTLGWAHTEFGCHAIAAELNQGGTEIAREAVEMGLIAGAPELYANSAINLSRNLMALGRLDEAEAALEPIERQFQDDPDPWMRWRWSTHLVHHQARLALARGDADGALALARLEVTRALGTAAGKLIGRAHEQLGRILLFMDAREEAEIELRTALTLAQGLEYPALAWRTRSLLAEVAKRSGDRDESERHRAAVRHTLDELAERIPGRHLVGPFRSLGEQALDDPVSAHR